MFWIAYHDPMFDGGELNMMVELPLNPTSVEYPPKRHLRVIQSRDGAVITQRGMADPRPRRWLWTGYKDDVPEYAATWAILQQMDYYTRLQAGLPQHVGIWENVSGIGGFDRGEDWGWQREFVRVKATQVTREIRPGGGPALYNTIFEFYIDDPTYTDF